MSEAGSRTERGLRRGGGLLAGLAAGAVFVVAVVGWLSVSGRLAGLQYANVPVVHPYPPAGQYVNPFTGDARDLVGVDPRLQLVGGAVAGIVVVGRADMLAPTVGVAFEEDRHDEFKITRLPTTAKPFSFFD